MASFASGSQKEKHKQASDDEGCLSIIGRDLHVVGELATDGIVKVEGSVVGSIRASRQVLITKTGSIDGDVYTREAIIGGQVTGCVYADDRVEVRDSSVIKGDISTKKLLVQEGGEVNGHIRMGDPRALEQGAKVAQREAVQLVEREAL